MTTNADIKQRISDFKNGVLKQEEFKKYKDLLSTLSEIDIFMLIDNIGYLLWRIEHDLADGRIDEYPEWDVNDKPYMMAEIELAVEKLADIIGEPTIFPDGKPTKSYTEWYMWWKNYINNISEEDWKVLKMLLESNGDTSAYRPAGTWKSI